jgi:uncharacterized membrane protein YbhN (UPF0104 family)
VRWIAHGVLLVAQAVSLGYRIVNYWLPLLPGAVAYLRLRLRPGAGGKRKGKGKPALPQAG